MHFKERKPHNTCKGRVSGSDKTLNDDVWAVKTLEWVVMENIKCFDELFNARIKTSDAL